MQALLEASAPQEAARPDRYQRLVQLLSRPRAALGVAALAFVLSLPALGIGLAADDFDLGFAVRRDPLSAYAFQSRDPAARHAAILAARDAGSVPWWFDPAFHQAFMRPLASLSLALDFAIFPSAPWLMHLENSLLFALTVLLAAAVYKAIGLSLRARGLATLFFALQPSQSMTTGWISGRNTLLATLFGFLTVRLFIAAKSSGGLAKHIAALLSFIAALLSAEAGISAVAYILAYALVFGQSAASQLASKAATERARIPAPHLVTQIPAVSGFLVVIAAWLVAYKLGGYGVKHSGFYVDPIEDPTRFAIGLLTSIPIYLASQLTIPYETAASMAPLALPMVTLLSLGVLYGTRRLWLPWVRDDSRGCVLGLGALLSILPLGASPPQGRMVSFIALGMCGLLALIIEERLAALNSQLPQRGALRLLRYHTVWAGLIYVPLLFASLVMVAGGGAILLDRELGSDTRPVLLINAPSFLPVHFFSNKREWHGEPRPPIDLMYEGIGEIELKRTGEQSFELTTQRGYFASRIERIARDPKVSPLHVGEVIPSARMRTQVLEVQDGAPTRVRFDITNPLSATRVYAWQGRTLEPLPLPNIGETVQIKPASAL